MCAINGETFRPSMKPLDTVYYYLPDPLFDLLFEASIETSVYISKCQLLYLWCSTHNSPFLCVQIYLLMKMDCYPRFKKSPLVKECLLAEMEGKPLPIDLPQGKQDQQQQSSQYAGIWKKHRVRLSGGEGRGKKGREEEEEDGVKGRGHGRRRCIREGGGGGEGEEGGKKKDGRRQS